MFEEIRDMVARVFGVPSDAISPGSSPDSIETWDSLQHLNLVLALEQQYDIQFSPEEIEQLLSVELIIAFVEEKVSASAQMVH